MSNFHASVITRLQSLLTKLGGSHTMALPTNFENEAIALLTAIDNLASWQASSKPTTRPNGTALVTGDRYLDTSDRLTWFWNGAYWLSEEIFLVRTSFAGGATITGGWGHHQINQSYNLFLLDFGYGGQLASPQDGSNYWDIRIERGNSAAAHTVLATINTASPVISAATGVSLSSSLNLHLDVSALGSLYIRGAVYKTLSPGNLTQGVITTRYRLAKP